MYPIKHVSVKTLFVYWKIIWDHVVRHNLLRVSEFKIITHMGKHMHDRIISPRGRRPYHFTKGKATVSVHQGEDYRIISPRGRLPYHYTKGRLPHYFTKGKATVSFHQGEGYRIITPRGRLLYHFPKGKANAYKTSFTLPHFIEVDLVFILGVSTLHLSTILLKLVWTRHFLLKCLYQVRKSAIMYIICGPHSTILDIGNVPTVWYFSCFSLY